MKQHLFRLTHRALIVITAFGLTVSTARSAGTAVAWGGGQPALPSDLGSVLTISTASDHSLALRADGTVAAWGFNFDGQCDVPAGLSGVTGVAAGEFFSLAVRNGRVVGWGDNQYGQIHVPTRIRDVVAVAAGRGHALALKSDGTVDAWGNNFYGQCDVPDGLSGVVAIVACWNYSMALRNNGTVVAWGVDDSGQTDVPVGLTNVKAISGGMDYALAVRTDGSVVGWGKAPAIPAELGQVSEVAAGENHVLALLANGTVTAWGDNSAGQTSVPGNLGGVQSIAAGWNYSVALSNPTPGAPLLLSPSWNPDQFSVSLQSEAGKSYTLEFNTNFTGTDWNSLTPVTGTGSSIKLLDTPGPDQQRFYRVRIQ